MEKSNQLKFEEMGNELNHELSRLGWQVEEVSFEDKDDYYDECLYYVAFTENGIFKVFNRLDLIFRPLNKEGTSVEITFRFHANPRVILRIVGPDKRSFGRKVRKDDLETFRTFCSGLLRKVGIEAEEDEADFRTQGRYIDFGRGEYFTAAYEVEIVYWKK